MNRSALREQGLTVELRLFEFLSWIRFPLDEKVQSIIYKVIILLMVLKYPHFS